MDWDDLSKHKIPEDNLIEELFSVVQTSISDYNDVRCIASSYNDDGNYFMAIQSLLGAMSYLEDALGYSLHITGRMLEVYPFGSNELAARVLERLNATGELTLPEPPEIDTEAGS